MEGALKRPKDRKEAQTLANYDRVYSIVEAGIVKYNLPRPLLFQSDADRRTSLTFFNKNEEVMIKRGNYIKTFTEKSLSEPSNLDFSLLNNPI